MDSKRITTLLAKKLSGEASGPELQELEDWLHHHPDEQYIQEIIAGWWASAQENTAGSSEEKEAHFNYIISQTSGSATPQPETTASLKTNRFHLWYYRIAAAAVLLICLAVWKFLPETSSIQAVTGQNNEIVTKKGTKSKVLLPDGSSVMLNADSRLTYSEKFNKNVREVILEGEAFFDVVKDSSRPFIVHTSGISIRVLGTAFNVKSYPAEPTIEATLVRGIIEVQKNDQPGASRIYLKPNEKLVYRKSGFNAGIATAVTQQSTAGKEDKAQKENISISTLPKVNSDSVRTETSWMYGRLLFEGQSFRQLAPAMERWFNVKISFQEENVSAIRFRGAFEDESVEEALQAMQLTAPFSYTINGNNVLIGIKK